MRKRSLDRRTTTLLVLSALVLSGCMTTRVEESKNAATGIRQGERVVILESSYHAGNETEDNFMSCVSKALQRGKNSVEVFPGDEFVDTLYPWLEPRTMPRGPDAMPELMGRPGVEKRLRESGVRYIVWVTGDTEKSSSGGSLSCAASPAGGGCFGLLWWENDSSYEAAIWDLEDGTSAGEVSTDVRGTSVIPALIVPIPLIARTQSAACKGLAQELRTFIVDSGPL